MPRSWFLMTFSNKMHHPWKMANSKTKIQKLLCEPGVSVVTESKKVVKGSVHTHTHTHTDPEGVCQSGAEARDPNVQSCKHLSNKIK